MWGISNEQHSTTTRKKKEREHEAHKHARYMIFPLICAFCNYLKTIALVRVTIQITAPHFSAILPRHSINLRRRSITFNHVQSRSIPIFPLINLSSLFSLSMYISYGDISDPINTQLYSSFADKCLSETMESKTHKAAWLKRSGVSPDHDKIQSLLR